MQPTLLTFSIKQVDKKFVCKLEELNNIVCQGNSIIESIVNTIREFRDIINLSRSLQCYSSESEKAIIKSINFLIELRLDSSIPNINTDIKYDYIGISIYHASFIFCDNIVICDMVNSYNLVPKEIMLQYQMHYPNIEYQKLGFAY